MKIFNESVSAPTQDELFEIANLSPKHAGLPLMVWISTREGAPHDDVRVKVAPGRMSESRPHSPRIMLAALTCMLTGCNALCDNTLVSKHPSPDGRFVAIVFYRNCGATTPCTTEISIVRPPDDAIPGGQHGNIFSTTDPDDSKTSLEHNGAIEARLDWKTPQLLSIATPRLARVDKRVDRIHNTTIVYSTFQ